MKRISLIIISGAMSLAPMSMQAYDAPTDSAATLARVLLFDHGQMGSQFWRIPALATSNGGTVIAVADKRNDSNRDLPNKIDLAMRRSTDNGLTWSEPVVILPADEGGGYGDAALGVHKPTGDIVVVCAHGNGLWESTPDDHQYLAVIRSSDDGLTWSEPVDITASLYDPVEGVAPLKTNAGFATSGGMLCDDQGRLMFVLVAPINDVKWGPLGTYMCYSDDGGYTWQINPKPVDEYGDESKITQLADGSLLMSIRNRTKAGRHLSRSTDRGESWTYPIANHTLVDPACNGDLIAISPQQVAELGLDERFGAQALDNGLIIHSLAHDPQARRNVSLLASTDLGVTWEPFYTVAPEGSAYSAIIMLPDGNLGCFSEEDCEQGGYRLWFTKIALK